MIFEKKFSIIIFQFLLCFIFGLDPCSPSPLPVNSESSLNRQKRTFDLGLIRTFACSQFNKDYKMPTFHTVPTVYSRMKFLDNLNIKNLEKRITNLENNEISIITVLQKLQDIDEILIRTSEVQSSQTQDKVLKNVSIVTEVAESVTTSLVLDETNRISKATEVTTSTIPMNIQ